METGAEESVFDFGCFALDGVIVAGGAVGGVVDLVVDVCGFWQPVAAFWVQLETRHPKLETPILSVVEGAWGKFLPFAAPFPLHSFTRRPQGRPKAL
jgi:hypothetical protein